MMTTITDQPPSFEDVVHSASASIAQTLSNIGVNAGSDSSVLSADIFGRRYTVAALALRGLYEEDEEELPDYDESTSPAQLPHYEERHLLEPVFSYNVYQIDRKTQILTPGSRDTFTRPRYRISAKSSLFSKKADFTLTRLCTGAAASSETEAGQEVAYMNFDRRSQIPWMPRANVKVRSANRQSIYRSYEMSAPNFSDWKLPFNDEMFFWRLTDKPTALSLIESSSDSCVARFAYSRHGTDANRGVQVGTFDVFGGSRSEDLETIEAWLATCWVPLNHWKAMGRHYRNDITPRNCSIAHAYRLDNNFFAHNGGGGGPRRASNFV